MQDWYKKEIILSCFIFFFLLIILFPSYADNSYIWNAPSCVLQNYYSNCSFNYTNYNNYTTNNYTNNYYGGGGGYNSTTINNTHFKDNEGILNLNISWLDNIYLAILNLATSIDNSTILRQYDLGTAIDNVTIIRAGNTSWKINNATYADGTSQLGGQAASYYLNTGSKVGNTTNEIREQFTGSNNISITSGKISFNLSCSQITGSTDLCDGSDATGSGGGTPSGWNVSDDNTYTSSTLNVIINNDPFLTPRLGRLFKPFTLFGRAYMSDSFENPYINWGQYQNYLQQTEDFSSATWIRSNISVVAANLALSPIYGFTAEYVGNNTADDYGGNRYIYQTVTTGLNGSWIFSVYATTNSSRQTGYIGLDIVDNLSRSNGINTTSFFNITNTSYYRYAINRTIISPHSSLHARIFLDNYTTVLWGAQLEYSNYSVYNEPNSYSGAITTVPITARTPAVTVNSNLRALGTLAVTSTITGAGITGSTGTFSAGVTMTTIVASSTITGTNILQLNRLLVNDSVQEGLILLNPSAVWRTRVQNSPSLRFQGAVNTSFEGPISESMNTSWRMWINNTMFNQTSFVKQAEFGTENTSISQEWINMTNHEVRTTMNSILRVSPLIVPTCEVNTEGYITYNYTAHKLLFCNSTSWVKVGNLI